MMNHTETIIALASAPGNGAISVIRLSGEKAIEWVDDYFFSLNSKKSLKNVVSHTIHLGHIKDNEKLIDEVLVSVFKNPTSYTVQFIMPSLPTAIR